MNRRVSLSLIAALALFAMILPATGRIAQAQPGGRHPAYLRALSDLRLARAYLDRLTPDERIDESQTNSIRAIDKAINDIKAAAIDDGKDLRDHPPIDAHISPHNRFQKARDALAAARRDISGEEDNPETRDLRRRSMENIRVADDLIVSLMHRLGMP